ncbi:SEC14-like protein 4 [Orchesella cincta]|uniref:SEC14-like protein 4 n=1 Tax=Orchesella cincta TaxID=48709 RepID=A0A1D2M7B9_ORCCI|nr:SEC14-like protein 4 [Orchesella cincta]
MDWADFRAGFSIVQLDKNMTWASRPILSVELGDWDLRSAVLTGKQRRLEKYLIYATELGLRGILKAQKDGKNVTRSLILADMDGFSFQTHACPVCVSLLVGWVLTMETYYPNFIDEIIVVNSPSFGVAVVNTIKSFMSPQTRNLIKIFDHNKNLWIKYLDARIDRNQRPLRYGGTRTEN